MPPAGLILEKDRVEFPPPPKLPTGIKRAIACFGLGLVFCVVFPRFFPLLVLSFYAGMVVIWFTDRRK